MSTTADQSVAIVTGAGGGIGRCATLQLVDAGYRVFCVGRTLQSLQETLAAVRATGASESACQLIVTDIASKDAVQGLVSSTLDQCRRVDTLINNAAIAPYQPLHECDVEMLASTFAVNTIAPITLVAQLWPVFQEQKHGCVVNISSMATIDPFPGLCAYAASKAALESLTRSIVREAGDAAIAAYSIAPGAVETKMLRSIASTDDLPTENTLDPSHIAQIAVDCVTGRRLADNGQVIVVPSP